jgi:hypothetical protein
MGNLCQNADTVSYFAGGILSGSVLQLFHDAERIVKHTIVLVSVNIDDSTDAAGIMLGLI